MELPSERKLPEALEELFEQLEEVTGKMEEKDTSLEELILQKYWIGVYFAQMKHTHICRKRSSRKNKEFY